MRTTIFTLLLLALFVTSCGGPSEATTTEQPATETSTIDEVASPSYSDQWETFKKAVINKDIKGIAAFASSDAVDAEALLSTMENQTFLDALKAASFEDLTVNKTESGESLEFHAEELGTDEEGNEVGNGITIFFSKGTEGLALDYFIAAG